MLCSMGIRSPALSYASSLNPIEFYAIELRHNGETKFNEI
jgi:hypothetical protein